jgi:hypothetical protein
MSKALIFIAGFLLVAMGIGILIKNWAILASMVKAFAGIVLALMGLVMMFSASFRR